MIDKFRKAIAFIIGGFVAIVTFGLVQVSMSGKTSGADNDDARNPSTLGQPLDEQRERQASESEPSGSAPGKAATPGRERKA